MNWLYFFIVLGISILDDILVVFYYWRIEHDHPKQASLLSVAIGGVQLLGFCFVFLDSIQYAIPLLIGNGLGTYLAMWMKKKFPQTKPRDKKTGRFKPPISPASFQLGDKK